MLLVAVAAWLSSAHRASAGGGPENIFLVVNTNSDDSKTIANHYIQLRQIPPSNVFYLDWKAKRTTVAGNTFRERILMPALAALEERRLNAQIDYLIYSTDLPWRVDLQPLYPDHEFKTPFAGPASITGATYLTPMVMGQSPAIVMPDANWYVPGPRGANLARCQDVAQVQSRGFRSQYLWDVNGNRTTDPEKGQRYLLSTMLGVTSGRGNTVEEILAYLRRSAAADGTRPRGTIYYMDNDDVRSTTRDKCFPGVAAQINRHGVKAEVLQGTVPVGARDVMGLTAGVANFDWSATRSTILPGAICEHLTSGGGILDAKHHTPFTDLLRHGAAGAAGTVREPMAIQAKFPLPSIHLHYVRGCSLAEAFYQSVSGPYQLLIVGDPLCRPWAILPKPKLSTLKPGQQVSGTLEIKPEGSTTGGHRIGMYELFVDGRLTARLNPGQAIQLDTTKLPDGYHELRIVAVHTGSVESRGNFLMPIRVKNHDAELELGIAAESGSTPAKSGDGATIAHAENLKVSVRQPGADSIEIRQNSRTLGRVQGEAGELVISGATLGRGPTQLQAFSDGGVPMVSAPLPIVVR